MVPLAGAFFPTAVGHLMQASLGLDNQPGAGVVGSTPMSPYSTTLSAPTIAGATVVDVTAVGTLVPGQTIQIDVNNPVGPTTSEVRKIMMIVGSAITLDQPLTYAHADLAAVTYVVAPFSHIMYAGQFLSSMTVEKRPGSTQAIQYAGVRVNKLDLKCQATNTAVNYTADAQARTGVILDSPHPVTVIDESPFIFAGLSLEYNSLTVEQANNITVSIDNKMQVDWTFNESHDAQFLTPAGLVVNGSWDNIYNSLDDADWGYLSQDLNEQVTAMVLNFTGAGGQSLALNLPKTELAVWKADLKENAVIMETVNFEASLDLEASPNPNTINAVLTNDDYLPF